MPTATSISPVSGSPGSPWDTPEAWDSILIGGIGGTQWGWAYQQGFPALIGSKVRIVGAKRKYKIEVKDPSGGDGAINTYRGVKLNPFDIVFFIYTAAQYYYFQDNVLPVLKFSGVKNAPNPSEVQSLTVYHPTLASLDIQAILVEEIGGIDPKEDGPNIFECKVRVVEYLPPPNLNTTVTPAGQGAPAPTAPVGILPLSANSKRAVAVNNMVTGVGSGVVNTGPGY